MAEPMTDADLVEIGARFASCGYCECEQCAATRRLIAEVRRLRSALSSVCLIAASPKHREVSQQGYGDIEEIVNVAMGIRA